MTELKPSQMRPRDRREDRPRLILDEAIRIIGQRGYYGFSIKELAESCGLTVAGVLHHFGTKVGLLVALLKDRDEKDSQAIIANLQMESAAAGAGASPKPFAMTDVRRVLHAVALRNAGQPEMVRLYAMLRTEAVYPEHPAFAFFQERNTRALNGLADLVRGHVPDPTVTAIQLQALLVGLNDLWLRDLASFDLVSHWDRAVDKLLT